MAKSNTRGERKLGMSWRGGRYYTSSSYLRYKEEEVKELEGNRRNEKVMRRQKLCDDMRFGGRFFLLCIPLESLWTPRVGADLVGS